MKLAPPPAQRQDRRHARPGLRHLRDDPRPVRGRRRRLPAQHEPRHPRRHRPAPRADSPGRGRARPPDRHPRRPPGAEAPLRHLRRRPGDARGGRSASASTSTRPRATPPASACRTRRSSRRCEAGSTLLVNDGKIRLKVIERSPEHAITEVVVGGEISNRKGVNVPDVVLPLAALSPKDRKDLEFACTPRRRLAGALLRAARRPTSSRRASSPTAARRSCRRSRSRRRSTPSPRSSRPRTASWSPAATSASSCRLLGAADPEAADPRLPRRRQAGDRRDPDAREHDHRARSRPAPRSPTSPPPSTRAPTRSCSRPSPPPATIRSRR